MTLEDEDTYYIAWMCKCPTKGVMLETAIRAFTGAKYVHVDAVFIPPVGKDRDPRMSGGPAAAQTRKDVMKQLFSTFIGEKFGAYSPKEWTKRSNETHGMIALQVHEDEFYRAREYMADLCTKGVAYNMSDLVVCGMPNTLSKGFMSDVDSSSIPSKVFCSQAMVLMLRHCVLPGRSNAPLIQTLNTVNSRGCSPQVFWDMMLPHCVQLDVESYVKDGAMVRL
jgi:hypothetical protein